MSETCSIFGRAPGERLDADERAVLLLLFEDPTPWSHWTSWDASCATKAVPPMPCPRSRELGSCIASATSSFQRAPLAARTSCTTVRPSHAEQTRHRSLTPRVRQDDPRCARTDRPQPRNLRPTCRAGSLLLQRRRARHLQRHARNDVEDCHRAGHEPRPAVYAGGNLTGVLSSDLSSALPSDLPSI